MKVKFTKKLISDDGKEFNIGCDIAFNYDNDKYIAEIADIGEKSFTGTRVVKNNVSCIGVMLFYFDKVGKCSYVSCD